MSGSEHVGVDRVTFPQSVPDSPLRGQQALLTGASYGIGAQLAAHMAAHGMNLALTARSRDKLEALANQLRSLYGVTVAVIPADLMRRADRDSVVPAATSAVGA